MVAAISALEDEMKKLSDAQLRGKTGEFRQQIDNGASVDDLMVPAYAVAREAGKRVLGMRHYDVQLVGGIVLHQGKIAEMKTGEGKTLVATLSLSTSMRSSGQGLARGHGQRLPRSARRRVDGAKIYNFLGLTVGVIVNHDMPAHRWSRSAPTNADITYGQNNEFGFDYLRDNMKFSIYEYVQRELNLRHRRRGRLHPDRRGAHAADHQRPRPRERCEKYSIVNESSPSCKTRRHYDARREGRTLTLTDEGVELGVEEAAQAGMVTSTTRPTSRSLHIMSQCAAGPPACIKRDHHYMVVRGGQGDDHRRVHRPQVSCRGGAGPTAYTRRSRPKRTSRSRRRVQTYATITFQNLFRMYNKLRA